MKATTIMNNKSFIDNNDSLNTVNEINNVSLHNTTNKHKSRSIKSNLKGGNNTKRYSKEMFNKQQQQRNTQHTPLNKNNNKLCESCMTMNVISHYKP